VIKTEEGSARGKQYNTISCRGGDLKSNRSGGVAKTHEEDLAPRNNGIEGGFK